jgi:hypothetical protein
MQTPKSYRNPAWHIRYKEEPIKKEITKKNKVGRAVKYAFRQMHPLSAYGRQKQKSDSNFLVQKGGKQVDPAQTS